jgi:hypothetical protein
MTPVQDAALDLIDTIIQSDVSLEIKAKATVLSLAMIGTAAMERLEKFAPNEAGLPDALRGGLERYIKGRIRCGDFLNAVLENDLRNAVNHADEGNRNALPAIVSYLYNEIPSVAWGSKQRVKDWLGGRYESDMNEALKGESE